MSGERVNILKDRAGLFLGLAEELYERGRLDLAFFHVEQACQLRIKATILRFVGEIPRVHSVRELLGMVAKKLEELNCSRESDMVVGFVREFRGVLMDIEDAYVESRYGVVASTRNVLSEAISVAKSLFRLLDQVEKSVLG